MFPLLIIVVFSYLAGSVPFGYILVRIFQGQDVRESGSGNIGATNVARSSPLLGLFTLLLDAGKGSAAVAVALLISETWGSGHLAKIDDTAILSAVAAFTAVLGHMFPIWLKFRGGKGVATGLGAFLLIAPKATLLMIGVFVITLLALRYVSFASIFTVALFPLPIWLLREYHEELLVLVLIGASSITIVLKHHQNIRRLALGTEPRFQLRRR
jgi:acyl phosphate:glycerol-3-phosphate acyltransferase